jgi:hypothetical protein
MILFILSTDIFHIIHDKSSYEFVFTVLTIQILMMGPHEFFIESLAASLLPITRQRNTSCMLAGGNILFPVIGNKLAALKINFKLNGHNICLNCMDMDMGRSKKWLKKTIVLHMVKKRCRSNIFLSGGKT